MTDKPRRYALRQLSEQDRRLWNAVARSIKPLRRRPPQDPETAAGEAPPAEEPMLPKQPAKKSLKPRTPSHSPIAAPHTHSPQPATPSLSPLARRERQRLARGGTTIDARIDLHGLTRTQAYAALGRFLNNAQRDGARFVLVITGKGARFADDGGERGALRREVPLWLRLPEFRAYVVGFEDAHITHGGEGALYVRIRRSRSDSGAHV